ncbi:nucleoside-triphosphate diphosphatase [Streptococcus oricebi]|uniref:dITP/XTP pyrophosphatase n=1 Tax=Streptococcus oricebi TaxID=1547447 RepID=A0ABS5B3K0_9STRE|nr:nucleoside-triphosphate diphosphatase [Streptococcus oricebi]MBP2623410.1 non-canonical purine NTP pyrophosphatase [Streptococcus oricebi]
MTSKIYEYRDENDWYIGEWSSFGAGFYFNDVPEESANQLERQLRELVEDGQESFDLVLIKYSSAMTLVQFVLNIINENLGTDYKAVAHQGTILIEDQDQLKKVIFLDKQGVKLTDFFAQESLEKSVVGDSILIATHNQGKAKEFRAIFEKFGLKVESLHDYPDLPQVEETGTTFEENARLKAETIAQLTGKMVLADDSGLQVDILGGLPGVWSARFAGLDATDQENNIKLLHELAMVFDVKDRKAHFHTTLVVASPGRESLVVEADWPGYIAHEPKGENGFGYDPLFLVGETGKTSAELTLDEKNSQSHRAQAVQKLVEVFPAWQNKLL